MPAESGFTGFTANGANFASYAAIVTNPNPSHWAVRFMNVNVDFHDADDVVMDSEEVLVSVLPGQTTAIGGEASGAGAAARMELVIPNGPNDFQAMDGPLGSYDASDIVTSVIGEQTVTTGTLTSHFPTDQGFVDVIAVYRNAAGAIIGGATGAVQSITAGGTAEFQIGDPAIYEGIATTEIYWHVGVPQ